MAHEVVPAARAAAHTIRIEAYHFQRRQEDVLREASRFRNLHHRPENLLDTGYKNHIYWVEYYAAWALLQLGRPAEAVAQFQSIISAYDADPGKWQSGTCLPQAYFGLWRSLRNAGVSAEEAKQQVAAFLEVFPAESYYVKTIQNTD